MVQLPLGHICPAGDDVRALSGFPKADDSEVVFRMVVSGRLWLIVFWILGLSARTPANMFVRKPYPVLRTLGTPKSTEA